MGIIDSVKGWFVSQNREVVFWQGIDYKAKKVYLKRAAIDKVLNFVSRSFSEAQFTFKQNNKRLKSDWEYVLNVKPNKNQSSSEFWKQAIYTLLFDNELLIIKTNDNQLLVAEDFHKEEWALYDTSFENVTVKGYTFERPFLMSDVIYITYNNQKLDILIDGLVDDYAEVYEALIGSIKRNNQVRGVMNINTTGTAKDDDSIEKMQAQIRKMLKTFGEDPIAIAPVTNGMGYEETSNKGAQKNQPYSDIDDLRDSLVDEVAEILGVPVNLIRGDKLELESNINAYKRLCINPLIKLLEDELNAKLITKTGYKQKKRVVIRNVVSPDVFDLASSADKLIASGVTSPNEARELLGLERVDDVAMDKHYITKNYTNELEGGD